MISVQNSHLSGKKHRQWAVAPTISHINYSAVALGNSYGSVGEPSHPCSLPNRSISQTFSKRSVIVPCSPMISVQLRPNRDPHCTPIILPFLVINEPMCFNISLLAPAPVAAAVATATTLAELSWVEAISIGTFGWENSREN